MSPAVHFLQHLDTSTSYKPSSLFSVLCYTPLHCVIFVILIGLIKSWLSQNHNSLTFFTWYPSSSLGLFTCVSKKVLELPRDINRAITHGRICLYSLEEKPHLDCAQEVTQGQRVTFQGDPSASATSSLPLYFILKFFAVPACAEGIGSAPCLAV